MTENAVNEQCDREPGARRIGVAGGGQLAQMMLPAAARLGLKLAVLDPDARCPAHAGAATFIHGGLDDGERLRELARACDVLTFEIEKVDTTTLAALEDDGMMVRPRAGVLAVIQDKLAQKRFLAGAGLATSEFTPYEPGDALPRTLPCVWKCRRDGYDGRGVAVLRSADDVAALPQVPALIEELVPIETELAILIARAVDGSEVVYPLTEIVMDQAAHVMDQVIAPAAVSETVAARCRELAVRTAAALDYVGIMALEFFVTRDGEVLINEISPRPHNSGHYTIEACATSQFEQHLRAVAGLPLGPADLVAPALTFNVLGAGGANGAPVYIGFDGWSDADRVHVHCYDKPVVRPGRKMGHVTVLGDSREAVVAKAAAIRDHVRVEGTA